MVADVLAAVCEKLDAKAVDLRHWPAALHHSLNPARAFMFQFIVACVATNASLAWCLETLNPKP
eukprot:2125601-Rhodomonas_salina.1